MRPALMVGVASLVLALTAPGAQAATTVGQAPPSAGTFEGCAMGFEWIAGGVASGTSYAVPGPGVITKWRTFGDPEDPGDQVALRVYTIQGTNATALFDSGFQTLAGGLNEFNTRFPVTGGERLGMLLGATASRCSYHTADDADTAVARDPVAVGTAAPWTLEKLKTRLDIAAIVEPDVDGDGYGDETQDGCPTDPGTHGQCPGTLVGQAPPSTGTFEFCVNDTEWIAGGVASGTSYTVPGPGVITKWRTFGDSGDPGDQVALRVYAIEGSNATALFDSGFQTLAGGLNEFNTRFPVTGGEHLGMLIGATASNCLYDTADDADTVVARDPVAVGTAAPWTTERLKDRVDIAAIVEPDMDGDGFGDKTQDNCPTEAGTQGQCTDKCPTEAGVQSECPDRSAPSAELSKTPKKKSKSRTATFTFDSDESGVSFECAIDKKALKPCESPKKFRKLRFRKHKFKLVATDAAGNESEQTTFSWRVVD